MYEDREGGFSYSILRRRSSSGEVIWIWQVRHTRSGRNCDAGTSLRSHSHAKTAVFESISLAKLKDWASATAAQAV
jgi:hypothetical protein